MVLNSAKNVHAEELDILLVSFVSKILSLVSENVFLFLTFYLKRENDDTIIPTTRLINYSIFNTILVFDRE